MLVELFTHVVAAIFVVLFCFFVLFCTLFVLLFRSE